MESNTPFKTPNRNPDTLFETLVQSREEAQTAFQTIAASRKVTWVEADSLKAFMDIENHLKALRSDRDVFLFLAMPKSYLSWDLVRMGTLAALDDALFRLWPRELRLYLAHPGPAFNLV